MRKVWICEIHELAYAKYVANDQYFAQQTMDLFPNPSMD